MHIQTYLTKQLQSVSLERMKVIAEIELQRLVDDRVIYFGECHYIRDEAGDRSGIQVAWTTDKESSVEKHIIRHGNKD